MTGIINPLDTDVLCGRGGATNNHPGNATYRQLVNFNKGFYTTCLKWEKLKISRSIVAAIRELNGRFLQKDAAKGSWFDIGDKKAIEKTSQALREGQSKLRQEIKEKRGAAPLAEDKWDLTRQLHLEEPMHSTSTLPGCVGTLTDATINPNDVLFGREGDIEHHVGYFRYQDAITNAVDEFNSELFGKASVICQVIQTIKAKGGRFMNFDTDSGSWVEMDDKAVRKKVRNAIQYASFLKLEHPDSFALTKQKNRKRLGSLEVSLREVPICAAKEVRLVTGATQPPPPHCPKTQPYNLQYCNPMNGHGAPHQQDCLQEHDSGKSQAKVSPEKVDLSLTKHSQNATTCKMTDVICGKGGHSSPNPGNKIYRELIHRNVDLYRVASNGEKVKISRSIVTALREENMHFLELDMAKGSWLDIGDNKAIEMTSEALRERSCLQLRGGIGGKHKRQPSDDTCSSSSSDGSSQNPGGKRQQRQAAATLVQNFPSWAEVDKKSKAQPGHQVQAPPRGIGPVSDTGTQSTFQRQQQCGYKGDDLRKTQEKAQGEEMNLLLMKKSQETSTSCKAVASIGESGFSIINPLDTDVLSTHGSFVLKHPGNEIYKCLLNLNKDVYSVCSEEDKHKISRNIVTTIREQNSRFLAKDAAKGYWFEICDKMVVEMTSLALRKGQPELGAGGAKTAGLAEVELAWNQQCPAEQRIHSTRKVGTRTDPAMTDITHPLDTDILSFRWLHNDAHPGNETYRKLLNLNKDLYSKCLEWEKHEISRKIVAAIRGQNGRFLEKDFERGTWFDIGDKKAIIKTSNVLSNALRDLRQGKLSRGNEEKGGVPNNSTAVLGEQQFQTNISPPVEQPQQSIPLVNKNRTWVQPTPEQGSNNGLELLLPIDYLPCPNTVIVGRGKKVAEHLGNMLFRELIQKNLTEYIGAQTGHKASIIERILAEICNKSQYAFVKQNHTTGQWSRVEKRVQRLTTAQAFRDALVCNYKSSRAFRKLVEREKKNAIERS